MHRLTSFRLTWLIAPLLLLVLTSISTACNSPLPPYTVLCKVHPLDTALTVSNGVAYFGLQTTVIAIRTNDGSQEWKTNVGGDASYATLANGVLYVGSGATMVALRGSDGKPLWQFKGPGAYAPLNDPNPIIRDGVIYVDSTTQVSALQASDGRLIWQYATGLAVGRFTPGLVLNQKTLYVSDDRTFTALQARNGTVLWKHQQQTILFSLSESGSQAYLNEGTSLIALRTSDGQQLWEYPLSLTDKLMGSSLATVAGIIYIQRQDGLNAIRESDGKLLWNASVDGQTKPTILNNVLYTLSSKQDTIVALNASTGAPIWQSARGTYFPFYPIIDTGRGVLYTVGSDTKNQHVMLLAFKTSDGSVLWTASDIASVLRQMSDTILYFTASISGCNAQPPTADVYAVQASNGHKLWHVHLQP